MRIRPAERSRITKTYAVGEEAIYIESGVPFVVSVTSNQHCNSVIERYTLKVKEIQTDNPRVKSYCTQPGEEFECQRLRVSGNRGLWALVEKA